MRKIFLWIYHKTGVRFVYMYLYSYELLSGKQVTKKCLLLQCNYSYYNNRANGKGRLTKENGGKKLWHFQIFSDGAKKQRRRQQRHAGQPAERQTGRKRNRRRAERPAERQTSRRRNRQHAEQPAERQTSQKRNRWRAEQPAEQQTNRRKAVKQEIPGGASAGEIILKKEREIP